MPRTEGRGFESRLCRGPSLAGSGWERHNRPVAPRDSATYDRRYKNRSWSYGYGNQAGIGCGVEKACHSTDQDYAQFHSLEVGKPTKSARDQIIIAPTVRA